MHNATSATTGTPKNHPANQSDLSPKTTDRSCGCRKTLDIADSIALVDAALERFRQRRRKTKAGAKKERGACPPDVEQALMVARRHLRDYRHLIIQQMSIDSGGFPAALIDPEQLMKGLSPVRTIKGEPIAEPFEPICKARAIARILLAGEDQETSESLLNPQDVTWGLILLDDLLIEAENRADKLQDHCQDLYKEFGKRIASCSSGGRDCDKRSHGQSTLEV
jgi:hypothetical protein